MPNDRDRRETRPPLVIGLINNMADAAMATAERQFTGLIFEAAGPLPVRMHLYTLPSIARGAAAAADIQDRYSDLSARDDHRLDALIVTGAEPQADVLTDEPYWSDLTAIVDWAEHNTVSTFWSCLAAHAAVLHLDGIRRRPRPVKASGLFRARVSAAGPLTAGLPAELDVPHSRWNDIDAADLRAHGYDVLIQGTTVGVDTFAKQWRSLFVFCQGHPEYDGGSLLSEYRRDLGRFLRGRAAAPPRIPADYLAPADAAALQAFADRAGRTRSRTALAEFPEIAVPDAGRWRAGAVTLARNWLNYIAAQKQRAGRSEEV